MGKLCQIALDAGCLIGTTGTWARAVLAGKAGKSAGCGAALAAQDLAA